MDPIRALGQVGSMLAVHDPCLRSFLRYALHWVMIGSRRKAALSYEGELSMDRRKNGLVRGVVPLAVLVCALGLTAGNASAATPELPQR